LSRRPALSRNPGDRMVTEAAQKRSATEIAAWRRYLDGVQLAVQAPAYYDAREQELWSQLQRDLAWEKRNG
jgi:hypothetical protein